MKALGGAEVRRSADRLTCEVADQGLKCPISTAMRKPSRNEAGWRKATQTALEYSGRDSKGSASLLRWQIRSEGGELD